MKIKIWQSHDSTFWFLLLLMRLYCASIHIVSIIHIASVSIIIIDRIASTSLIPVIIILVLHNLILLWWADWVIANSDSLCIWWIANIIIHIWVIINVWVGWSWNIIRVLWLISHNRALPILCQCWLAYYIWILCISVCVICIIYIVYCLCLRQWLNYTIFICITVAYCLPYICIYICVCVCYTVWSLPEWWVWYCWAIVCQNEWWLIIIYLLITIIYIWVIYIGVIYICVYIWVIYVGVAKIGIRHRVWIVRINIVLHNTTSHIV